MIMTNDVVKTLQRQNRTYSSPESAANLAHSLESLSSDIYTDRTRFVYELLQNSDDASSSLSGLDVRILFLDDYMVFAHAGEPFSEIDLESICSIGDGNKRSDENKTGFKGIGFKSVFAHSDWVAIQTGPYTFRFDKDYWLDYWDEEWGEMIDWQSMRYDKRKDVQVKMPWQIIPIPTELPASIRLKTQRYSVSTIIKHHDLADLEEELLNLFSETQILLFLRSKNVTITIEQSNGDILSINKESQGGIVKLSRDGIVQSEWMLRTFTLEVDEATRERIEWDTRIPKKLRSVTKTDLSFAIPLNDQKIQPVEEQDSLVFTYLPTSVNFGFPFLVNGSFITDAGRQHLHDDLYWNNWLFSQIPIYYFKWLAELAATKYQLQLLKITPNEIWGIGKNHISFRNGYEQAVESVPFLVNTHGELVKLREAIYDATGITQELGIHLVLDYLNQETGKNYLSGAFIKRQKLVYQKLGKLGGKIFASDDLVDLLSSPIFRGSHVLGNNASLIRFLFKLVHADDSRNQSLHTTLKEIAFIFDESGQLRSPKELYLPGGEFPGEFSDNLPRVHSETLSSFVLYDPVLDWMGDLGISKPSETVFIEKTLIPNQDFVTAHNALDIGKFLFRAYQKGILQSFHFEKLKTLKVLTKHGNLIHAAQAFFSDGYQPELRLEGVYHEDIFLSETYLDGKSPLIEWKLFWIKMGVSESIKNVDLGSNFVSTLLTLGVSVDYIEEGRQKAKALPNYKKYPLDWVFSFRKLSFIEFASQHAFSKIFWNQLMSQYSPNDFRSLPSLPMGHYNGYCYMMDYNKWTFLNLSIFPTTQRTCQKANEVFINRPEIAEIAGDFLPVFDYEGVVPMEWANFLPFKSALELADYFKVLSGIAQVYHGQEDRKSVNKARIHAIYKKLALNFLGYPDELRYWGGTVKFLAKDGRFYPAKYLAVVNVDGFNAPRLIDIESNSDEGVLELLRLLGVKVIDQVKSRIPNSTTESHSLKTRLQAILPLLAAISLNKAKAPKEWEEEYERLRSSLSRLSFFETTEIYLTYGDEQDMQERSSWAEGGHFYYVGNWYKPRVLDGLVAPLCRSLGIRYAERHLSVLLLDSFEEGLAYLKEKLGEDVVKLIPVKFLDNSIQFDTISIPANRPYNPTDAEIGRKGDLLVYEYLKSLYSQKYGQPIQETSFGFVIGQNLSVHWKNISIETTENHDFKIIEAGKDIYIDSKATTTGYESKEPFWVSRNEISLMEQAERYLIARVFNVGSNHPQIKWIRLSLDELA
jgi:hypothetical protein